MNWNLPDENAHTLAGLLIQYAKRLPEKGESFQIQELKLTILQREKNQLKSILAEVIG
jgi:Mg2+/Co2+ transporter CorB